MKKFQKLPTREVTLICLIVGTEGNAFPVDVTNDLTIDHLKGAIKAKKLVNLDTCTGPVPCAQGRCVADLDGP